MWDWADPKAYLHDEIASDKRNPTVNANGPIYGALEASADYMPVVDPKTHTRDAGQADRCAIRRRRAKPTRRRRRRRRTGATKRSGPARPTRTASRWTSRRASGSRRASVRTRRRRSARQGSNHPSAKAFPIDSERPPDADVRPEDEEGHDDRHLLRHAPPELRQQRRAVVHRRRAGRGLVRHHDLRQDQGRAEGAGLDGVRRSTPTATASATRTSSPISRSIPPRTSASTRRSTAWRRARSMARSGDRCWACPASLVRLVARIESAGRRRCPRSTRCRGTIRRRRLRASRRAAWTSTATASSGRCSRAGSSPASIAASARAR